MTLVWAVPQLGPSEAHLVSLGRNRFIYILKEVLSISINEILKVVELPLQAKSSSLRWLHITSYDAFTVSEYFLVYL